MRLLESYEEKALQGFPLSVDDLEFIASNIAILKQNCEEHRALADTNSDMLMRVRREEVNLQALNLRLTALQQANKGGAVPASASCSSAMFLPKKLLSSITKQIEKLPAHLAYSSERNIRASLQKEMMTFSNEGVVGEHLPGSQELSKAISYAALEVLDIQSHLEGFNFELEGVDEKVIDRLQDHIMALEMALKKVSQQWPKSSVRGQMDHQLGILKAKLHTIQAYQQALKPNQ
jgi:hypothetical protein